MRESAKEDSSPTPSNTFTLPTHSKRSTPLDEKSLLSPSRETLAEESAESQHQQRQQQQEQEGQEQEDSGSEVPQRLETHEENDHQEARRITSTTARRVQSTIPNLIEDEFDDDADLGLHVEYMDEVGRSLSPKQQGGGSLSSSRAGSARSQGSTVSDKMPLRFTIVLPPFHLIYAIINHCRHSTSTVIFIFPKNMRLSLTLFLKKTYCL